MELKKFKLEQESHLEERAFRLLELELKNDRSPTHVDEHFDITRYVRLVTPFNEQHADCYFNGFEKIAINDV